MNFHVITLFPEAFDSYLKESIIGRAIKEKRIKVAFVNPRKFVTGKKYKRVWPDGNVSQIVDDKPYGGGPGMVIRAEPTLQAVESVLRKIKKQREKSKKKIQNPKIKIINFSPSGEKFTTEYAKTSAKKYTDIIMLCGRYEGIDARVGKILKAEEISIGDYVLTGGELPAMVLIDSMARQIKGVLGKFESLEEERVSSSEFYTRPEVLEHKGKKYKVPPVLLSGDHKKIEEWKKNNINK
ncbi:MAG: tRNA (guanosine(37)-N1)-methyltransferase TrmD [Candidatus Pacebacteria bacterium]|nr:tRNA (guanosine(37)-N1)-methyltransferase TrmD [Candidatus Paceibacterota bacterium]